MMTSGCRRALAGAVMVACAALELGCGGSSSSAPVTGSPVVGTVTPTVTVTPSSSSGTTTAQALNVAVSVTASGGAPTGTVVLSSGSYASFPVTLSGGQTTLTVPAGLLAAGMDALTVNFVSANSAAYNNASGSANVTVTASGAALPVVTASSATYSTAGYGSPFRALPLVGGKVLVSVTAATSGIVVFWPGSGGLQLSCFNYVRPAFVQDGASDLGINLLPNGMGLAAALGVDGAVFYNLSTLENCTSTGVQVSQGTMASNQGSFDVVTTPDGKFAFVANEYGVAQGATTQGNIGVVSLQYDANGIVTAGTLVGQISTGGQAIAGVTMSPDGARLYVTSEVAGTGSAAGAGNPILSKANCVQQAGGTASANGLLSVIDVVKAETSPTAAAILATVNAGCSPVRIVETSDLSTLWVAARGDNRVLAFSTGMLEMNAGNALLGYADTGGTAPVGLRLFEKEKLLAVANSNRFSTGGSGLTNATVLSVAVPAAASVVQTIPTGLFPREITVGSDDATLYLTNYNSQTLQVITTKVQ